MQSKGNRVLDMVYAALFAVVIAICSWLSIPMAVPFTMQTFGVFCALGMLGGKRGLWAVLVYVLMGAVGLPVFSGFSGGVGALLGATGGYIVGFVFAALVYWALTSVGGSALWVRALGMCLGLVACYGFGTAWFMGVYARTTGDIGLKAALTMCVVPFIIPDAVKLCLALLLSARLPNLVHIREAYSKKA